MFNHLDERNKTGSKLRIGSVSSCYFINDKKPKNNQPILYMGNLGLAEGTYRNYKDGIGWVCLPDGGIDCFDEWVPNNC